MDQQNPTIKKTPIDGVFEISRPVFPDDRGQFHELARIEELESFSQQKINIKQVNVSKSIQGVLRGVHIAPWGKLMACLQGEVFAAIVDTRPSSKTFKQIHTVNIGDNNQISLWIPPGCGNSFLATGQGTNLYLYAVTMEFGKLPEIGLAWNDGSINIPWPTRNPNLSDKDKSNKTLNELLSSGTLE